MSIQRAVVNCRRCYETAYGLIRNRASLGTGISRQCPEYQAKDLRNNEQIWQARNEAMRALESGETIAVNKTKIIEALDACMRCDYKTDRIAEKFEPNDGAV